MENSESKLTFPNARYVMWKDECGRLHGKRSGDTLKYELRLMAIMIIYG